MKLIANALDIQIAESPEEAPTYPNTVTAVNISKCIIVKKGTVKGLPTVDFQLVDEHGKQYVAMLTGGIVSMLFHAVKGADDTGTIQ